ncbi:hypothetical protein DXG03_009735 [Asterophora parasitica]|uniref:CCHC-type domain-containing protein n=1 Tax=Asterophora parasitica TaxID=117018 RepID=A0A9P7FZS9_9AGAR|nr:hypothetical protein DXG03_009735 [Asterophora parasitica]
MDDNNEGEYEYPQENSPLSNLFTPSRPRLAHSPTTFGLQTPARLRMADRELERDDLGTFDGTRTKFAEWRTCAQAWIRVQENWSKQKVAIAIWTRLQGGRAGQYGMAQLQKYMNAEDADPDAEPWPTTKILFEELTARFEVVSERDYALQKIENLKQGSMKIDDFLVEFKALATKSNISETQTIDLLEQNVNSEIIQALFWQGKRKTVLAEATTEILRIGRAMEMYCFMKGNQRLSGWTSRAGTGGNQQSAGGSNPKPLAAIPQYALMDVDATCTKSKVQCFKCKGYGHFACDCKKKINVRSMDYEEMQKIFYAEFEQEKESKE